MKNRKRQLGMSMIEVMVVLLITTVITGAVFTQIANVQRRSASEQVKLDLFQESRDFVDQISRDLHQAGYPSPRNFAAGQITSPSSGSAAAGLVKVSDNELWFEGDMDGSGSVEVVKYKLVTDGDNCPCLRRGEITKTDGVAPASQPDPSWYTEVQNVQNGDSTTPIFYAFTGGGTAISLPSGGVTFASDPTTIAKIDTIKVVVTTKAKHKDQNGNYPIATLVSTVRLNNCSQAASAQSMSCQ